MDLFKNSKTGLKHFVSLSAAAALLFYSLASCSNGGPGKPVVADTVDMATFPQKKAMILMSDRPPQLETPLSIFKQDITPNDYFFVRWHMSQLVNKIDADTFRLYIGGNVARPLALSLTELKTQFPADSVIALAICAGNSRSTFNPRVPGTQWKNGAMGNAKWKGVKLKYLLEKAGIQPGAVDVVFQGLDKGVLPGIPGFIKSLSTSRSLDGEVLVAYEMNGTPIPMLNGFPLKLVVPGWYATYWVGALSNITVLNEPFKGYWMEKAYLIAKNATATEKPDSLAKDRIPITSIQLHSIFVAPEPGEKIKAGTEYTVEGLAFNDGSGISKVEVSEDDGMSWKPAVLNPALGKYSWQRWKYLWKPASGLHHLAVRATDSKGYSQVSQQWNRSGYARTFIEHLDVNVE